MGKATKKEYAEFIDKTYGGNDLHNSWPDDPDDEFIVNAFGKVAKPKRVKPKVEVPVVTEFWLPRTNDTKRTMSNHLARSSLFAPVARGRKKMFQEEVLVSRTDAVIKYSGEQLDETQADLWMYLMHRASKQPLGENVHLSRAAILNAIGRSDSKSQYDWLLRSMKSLSFAMLTMDTFKDGGKTKKLELTRVIHLINGFDTHHETGDYLFYVDTRWMDVYSNEYALINWELRNQISQGQDMAKAIQRLIATSNNKQQFYSLDWLKGKLSYASPLRKFKQALLSAVTELKRVGIITSGTFRMSTRDIEQIEIIKP
jgi:hypothetical protein